MQNVERRNVLSRRSIDGDKEITILLNTLKKKSNNILALFVTNPNFFYDLNITEEQYFKYVLYVLSKPSKSANDVIILAGYLLTLPSFVAFFKKDHKNIEEIIQSISYSLGYERLDINKLLFKTGDKGDKFYIILKGKIGILIAKESTMEMSEVDYIRYLARLKKHQELELMTKCIQVNRKVYPISEDNLETFFLQAKKSGFRYSKKGTLTKEILDQTMSYLMEQNNYVNVTPEEYINNTKPITEKYEEIVDTHKVVVYQYHLIVTLSTGDKFGDAALDNKSQKRTATIITLEETHFGTLNKNSYTKSIKEANEKIKKSCIIFLLNNQLLKNISNPESFEQRYYNYFVNNKYDRGHELITEDTIPTDYFFIRDGEYEVYTKKSINELNYIIKKLGGEINLREENRLLSDNAFFYKMYHDKQRIKISIIKDKDIIGFEDLTYNGKFICNVQCVSYKGECFKIEKRFYDIILSREEKILTNNYREFVATKRKILRDKLINIKNIKIQSFLNKNPYDPEKILLSSKQIKNNIITIKEDNIPVIKKRERKSSKILNKRNISFDKNANIKKKLKAINLSTEFTNNNYNNIFEGSSEYNSEKKILLDDIEYDQSSSFVAETSSAIDRKCTNVEILPITYRNDRSSLKNAKIILNFNKNNRKRRNLTRNRPVSGSSHNINSIKISDTIILKKDDLYYNIMNPVNINNDDSNTNSKSNAKNINSISEFSNLMNMKAKKIWKLEDKDTYKSKEKELFKSKDKELFKSKKNQFIFSPSLDTDKTIELQNKKDQVLEKFRIKFLIKNLQMNRQKFKSIT